MRRLAQSIPPIATATGRSALLSPPIQSFQWLGRPFVAALPLRFLSFEPGRLRFASDQTARLMKSVYTRFCILQENVDSMLPIARAEKLDRAT
jgi:hypothetical protein